MATPTVPVLGTVAGLDGDWLIVMQENNGTSVIEALAQTFGPDGPRGRGAVLGGAGQDQPRHCRHRGSQPRPRVKNTWSASCPSWAWKPAPPPPRWPSTASSCCSQPGDAAGEVEVVFRGDDTGRCGRSSRVATPVPTVSARAQSQHCWLVVGNGDAFRASLWLHPSVARCLPAVA